MVQLYGKKQWVDLRDVLGGDFAGCRGWTEVHDPQWMNRIHREDPVVQVVFDVPDDETIRRVLNSKNEIVMELSRDPE